MLDEFLQVGDRIFGDASEPAGGLDCDQLDGGVGGALAAGFGGAGFTASAAGFAGCPAASLPAGEGAWDSPGFCSSAISIPCEDSYTYHLRTRVSNSVAPAKGAFSYKGLILLNSRRL